MKLEILLLAWIPHLSPWSKFLGPVHVGRVRKDYQWRASASEQDPSATGCWHSPNNSYSLWYLFSTAQLVFQVVVLFDSIICLTPYADKVISSAAVAVVQNQGLQLHTANNRTRVSFVMIKQGVRKEVAKLSVSCRKGHNINVAIDMKHSADLRFVDGELRSLSYLFVMVLSHRFSMQMYFCTVLATDANPLPYWSS